MKTVYCFVQHYKGKNPGQRYRLEQFEPYLKRTQFKYLFWLNKYADQIYYSDKNLIKKALLLTSLFFYRLYQTFNFPIGATVLIQRESFPVSNFLFDWIIRKRANKLIFDFDDAIWLTNKTELNHRVSWLKEASSINYVLSVSDIVIAGNEYLSNYAKSQKSKNVVVIPTTVDQQIYNPLKKEKKYPKEEFIIGWVGSFSTNKYLKIIEDSILKLQKNHANVKFFIMSNQNPTWLKCSYEYKNWSLKNEIDFLNKIHLGVMPLEETEWEKGKCGLKLLLYQSVGSPCVGSSVGINSQIIQHESSGFLIGQSDSWYIALKRIISDKELFELMSKNSLKSSKKFATQIWAPFFEKLLSLSSERTAGE